jgi:malate dehydrogenase (oxaloacetate-decarboxylating)
VVLQGTTYTIGQANNALIFPGLGLGAIVARAGRITDGMITASAHTVAGLTDTSEPGAPILPRIGDLAETSLTVATAVAQAAVHDGVAQADLADGQVDATWHPRYRPIRAI